MASRTAAILEKRRLDSRPIERLRRRRGAVMGMPLWKRPSEVHVYVSAKLVHHPHRPSARLHQYRSDNCMVERHDFPLATDYKLGYATRSEAEGSSSGSRLGANRKISVRSKTQMIETTHIAYSVTWLSQS